jgi:gliding motility-associated-like protein
VIGYPPLDIHIPNVFTPNGDNSNDEFFIAVTNGASIKVTIFNRWGNQMFEINDFTTKWNGKDATEGVYFFKYEIVGLDGQILEGHGHVTLLRK